MTNTMTLTLERQDLMPGRQLIGANGVTRAMRAALM